MKIFKNESAKDQVMKSYHRLLEMWETPYQEHIVDTAYGTTHCIVSGNERNPPLLLFHGVGDNSAVMWALNIKELSRHFYCMAIDTIGGPGKSVPNERYARRSFSLAGWIDRILDHFAVNNANIAGVSNGAYMAYRYASVRPEQVRRAVCMEGGMVINPLQAMFRTLLMMFPEILVPTDRNLLRILKKLSSPGTDLFEKHPLLAEHLILLMRNHNRQAMFVHKLEKYDSRTGAAIKDKLCFLIAEHHIKHKKDLMNVLNEGGFHYKVVQGAGHGINHEQPDVVNREIVRFLLE